MSRSESRNIVKYQLLTRKHVVRFGPFGVLVLGLSVTRSQRQGGGVTPCRVDHRRSHPRPRPIYRSQRPGSKNTLLTS